ncbi:MAG: NAD-dependent deacetylase, partial [bacterium]|jgi:NAD-dependent deacetylase
MPPAFGQAMQEVQRSQLVLVVGSSLTVSPANTLAYHSGRLAIVNREPTVADDRAEVVVYGTAGETLHAVTQELGLRNNR